MPTTFTLNTGTQIPWLGFGTGTALYSKDASQLVRQAIDAGVNHLDGAQMYNNEETLGTGIKQSGKPRAELFITTKLNGKVLQPGQTIKDTLQVSLQKLGLEYVDLFLIHDPTPATKQSNETLIDWWKQMEGVYADGLAKAIGVSNFKVSDLEIILPGAKVIPAANQIELHPYVWQEAEPIVRLCHEKGIVVESYGGLSPIVRVPGGPLDPTLETIRQRLAKDHGQPVSAGQVLTKWLSAKKAVVVTTTSKVERIKEFQDLPKIPDLTLEEVKQIEESGAELHKRSYMGHVFQ
ncbi:NADP-dependent oxidoreductase domain-containing protein [Crepidotus variabilis]|uniref:NADP-dependent oxidoreductase domain-containing protein n=1 Tax=Crepidotus variabilis TaxID=179855 RepID=A0A9P6EDF6_9AGAR|nr:NADP-dependent oxidoreductase domain-containing protein [Crepidotus variabilis]